MRRNLLKPLGGIALVLLLLVLLAWPAAKLFIWHGERTLAAMNLPRSYAELYPPIPETENAEPPLREALSSLSEYPRGRDALNKDIKYKRKGMIARRSARMLDAWIEHNDPVIQEARAALNRPRFRIASEEVPGEFSDPLNRQLFNLISILIIKAQQATQSNKLDEALRYHIEAITIAKRRIECAMSPIEFLLGTICFSVSEHCIREFIQSNPISVAQLRELRKEFISFDPSSSFINAIKGDVIFKMNHMDNPMQTMKELSNDSLKNYLHYHIYYDYAKFSYICSWVEAMDNAQSIENAKNSIQKYDIDHGILWNVKEELLFFMYGMTMRTIDKMKEAGLTTKIKNDMVILDISLEQYKAQHGDYPQHLADLVPETIDHLPTDPRTEEDYAYARQADGYSLTSTGCLQATGHERCAPQ